MIKKILFFVLVASCKFILCTKKIDIDTKKARTIRVFSVEQKQAGPEHLNFVYLTLKNNMLAKVHMGNLTENIPHSFEIPMVFDRSEIKTIKFTTVNKNIACITSCLKNRLEIVEGYILTMIDKMYELPNHPMDDGTKIVPLFEKKQYAKNYLEEIKTNR